MPQNYPEIFVEHEQTRAIVSFVAPVTESSIIYLVRTVNDLRKQRYYHDVELQIASPGGEVLALQYFVDALSHWRDDGLNLTTLALTSCSSAAAVMLSLGDRRKASPASSLLYHFARIHVNENVSITRTRAHFFAESLELTDTRILDELVSRAACNTVEVEEFTVEDRNTLNEIRTALAGRFDDTDHPAWLRDWITETKDAPAPERHQRWKALYRVLCESDRSISGRLAHGLGLVDELVEPMAGHGAAPPPPIRSIVIPEWTRAYKRGAVDVNHLKRHTLVMGETGSGKTASAILPMIAAAYHSPEVGVALIIDPKYELGTELNHLLRNGAEPNQPNKRIVWIKADEIMVDLMSTEGWSIGELIKDRRYWTAAERVLQRLAGFSGSNPAQLLLGKPALGSDPYWEREGLKLATAVIAIAIEWSADWLTIAQLIKENLNKTIDTPQYAQWESVLKCVSKVHPHVFVLHQKWKEWVVPVREYYAWQFGHVLVSEPDEDGRRTAVWVPFAEAAPSKTLDASNIRYQTDIPDFIDEPDEYGCRTAAWVPSAEAAPSKTPDAPNSRYQTDIHDFIHGQDERSRYEEEQLQRLKSMANGDSERGIVKSLIDIYRKRIKDERDGWTKERETQQREALERLSDNDLLREIVDVVHDRLPDGVGGRTEAEWKSMLSDALGARIRKIKETSEASRAVMRKSHESAAYDDDLYRDGMGNIADHEKQDLEQALADLIVEGLKEADAKEWKSFPEGWESLAAEWKSLKAEWETLVEAAKQRSVENVGTSLTSDVKTTFLEVLNEFENMMMVVEDFDNTMETRNVIAVGGVILEDLLSVDATGAEVFLEAMRTRGGEWEKIQSTVLRIAQMRNTATPQFMGIHGSAVNVMSEFSTPGVERVVYFGCERPVTAEAERKRNESEEGGHGAAGGSKFLDFREAVSNRESSPGVMYIYQPSRHKHDDLIAKACKTLFFEAVLDSPERRKAGRTMPLAGYIADEFQRFITADRVHGEQSFLDVCRSFGAFAVLACQSIASLRYALCEVEGDPVKLASAIDIICNNTGTKMFFRTTDPETSWRVRTLGPILSDGRSVIDSRPLSTLKPGECYASFPDGRFERVQIDEYGKAGQQSR